MAFLVVTLHSLPTGGSAGFAIVAMVCRCAVPFYLITSGYFLRPPQRFTQTLVTRPLVRLLPIYVFWMIVYYVVAYAAHSPLRLGLHDLLSGGLAFHLWYLPALGFALVVVSVGVALLGSRATGLACAVLAAATIARGTYHDALHLAGSPARGGLIVAPLFVFIGYWLARRKIALSLPVAAALAIAGLAVMAGEDLWLSHRLGAPLISHDFTIGTFAYGTGVFLFARALPASPAVHSLAKLGLLALGIYVSHLLFVWGLRAVFGDITLVSVIWRAPLAFACAVLLTMAMRRVAYLKWVTA